MTPSFSVQTLPTPLGPFTFIESESGVRAAGFAAMDEFAYRYIAVGRLRRAQGGRSLGHLNDYFNGDLAAIRRIAVDQPGPSLFSAAWKALRSVPSGTTISYTELAQRVGSPRAARAAASACARNAVCLVVPCHRAIRSDGTAGGYYYGLAHKRWLLAHEQSAGLQERPRPNYRHAGAVLPGGADLPAAAR